MAGSAVRRDFGDDDLCMVRGEQLVKPGWADRFHEALGKKKLTLAKVNEKSVCPEWGHQFQGNSWDGIDAHWRSKHETIMPYTEAWPLIRNGKYER